MLQTLGNMMSSQRSTRGNPQPLVVPQPNPPQIRRPRARSAVELSEVDNEQEEGEIDNLDPQDNPDPRNNPAPRDNPPPHDNPPRVNNLPPQPNPPANENPLKVLKYFRKYDGKSDANQFITQLETDLVDYRIAYRWISYNLDRILEGEALDWFQAVSPEIYAMFIGGDLWEHIVEEFLKFFDHRSLLNTHKQANRSLLFSEKSDPQEYVTKKVKILRNINPRMTDSRKVEQLIKGLPIKLQIQFSSLSLETPHQFLEQLRKIDELFGRHSLSIPKAFSFDGNSVMLDGAHRHQGRKNFQPPPPQQPLPIPCSFHNTISHTTEQCFNLKRLADNNGQNDNNAQNFQPHFNPLNLRNNFNPPRQNFNNPQAFNNFIPPRQQFNNFNNRNHFNNQRNFNKGFQDPNSLEHMAFFRRNDFNQNQNFIPSRNFNQNRQFNNNNQGRFNNNANNNDNNWRERRQFNNNGQNNNADNAANADNRQAPNQPNPPNQQLNGLFEQTSFENESGN